MVMPWLECGEEDGGMEIDDNNARGVQQSNGNLYSADPNPGLEATKVQVL